MDLQLEAIMAKLLEIPHLTLAQRSQIHTKIKEGGVGIPSTTLRGEAAFLGAWEGGLAHTAAALGFTSLVALRTAWPAWANTIDETEKRWAARTGRAPDPLRWETLLTTPKAKHQKELADTARTAALHTLRNHLLTRPGLLALEMCSGADASQCMTDDTNPLSTDHLRATLRFRLQCDEPVPSTQGCQHKGKCGRVCNKRFPGDGGHHSRTCALGGGVMRRHDAIRDALIRWLKDLGTAVSKEQIIPRWCTADEQAKLDIIIRDDRLG